MATAEKLLALARKELGVKEAPAGTNRVKYNTAYYGREVAGTAYPWCCVFQWWLFRAAEASRLFYGGGKTASCTTLYNWYKRQGQTVEKGDIRPGDLVFFVFDGNRKGVMNHIGICESVEPGYVTTIDGNTGTQSEANGGAVMRRRRALKYVGGAARPAYKEEEGAPGGSEGSDGERTNTGMSEPSGLPIGEGYGGCKDEMKLYRYVKDMPAWARETATKAINNGYIRMDETGAVGVWECNLQALVWMDRAGLLDAPAREV